MADEKKNGAALNVTWDYSGLLSRLDRLRDKVLPYMKATFRAFAETGASLVKERTPDTSPGRTAIKDMWELAEYTEDEATSAFIIRNTYKPEKVIEFFEFGTRAHDIPVGRFGFLHFTTDEGEEVYTKKTVKHPGTRPWLMVARTKWQLEAALDAYVAGTLKMIDSMLGEVS